MGITAKQLDKRAGNIGSSDLAAILNMSPYANAHDVYASKVYGMEPLAVNKAIEAGNLLEEPLLQYTVLTVGAVIRNQGRRVKGFPIHVNIDAIIKGEQVPVEAKSVGIMNPYESGRQKEWGEEMSSEVPDDVAIQCHGHMLGMTADPGAINGYPEHCYVPTILATRGFCMFVVPFDREVASMILDGVQSFWKDHVEAHVPPPIVPTLDTIKRIHRMAGEVVDLGDDEARLLGNYESHKWDEKASHEQKSAYQSSLLSCLGDAEAARLPDGRMVTYYQQTRKSIDREKLKTEHPDVFEEVQKTSTYRVMRVKKAAKQLEVDSHGI